ncbi:Teneurin-a [Orchesella cincta]|uniref:Teneurin-a n=1 Tax=Orchesella cincta TaxID=48709 RepID=A0A1D2N9U4_ORCCI|nr:Teneurin-a [Orchesella cincta]
MGNCSRYPGTGCIVVEDAKVMARGDKHYPVIDLTSISPKTSEVEMVSPTSLVPEVTSKDFGGYNEGLSPMEILWGQVLTSRIQPYSYWTLELDMRDSAYANLNFSFPWGSNWALLFRKNALPSITQHDLMKIVKNGRIEHRNKIRHVRWALADSRPTFTTTNNNNSYPNLHNASTTRPNFINLHRVKRDSFADQSFLVFSEYLESGKWFLRLFNDDLLERKVSVLANIDANAEVRCPQQCTGNGNCVYGKCHCFDGFGGVDCSISVCPVLCSNHGRYSGGICHCEAGWKGAECDIPEAECEIGNCNGNGDCVAGKCVCRKGWTGAFCDKDALKATRGGGVKTAYLSLLFVIIGDCADPTCSEHGSCYDGKCLCNEGWSGILCNVPDTLLAKCIPDCSSRGEFDAASGRCLCQKPYVGPNCMEVACDKECGQNGFCNAEGKCECKPGWSGDHCEFLTCDSRCQEHGQCKNGTCICSLGWNGKHCTLAGCSNSCSHHGSCIMQDGWYSCKCSSGWAGEDCSIRLETNCSDDIDNDEDGMTDCSDSECCDDPNCRDHLMCMTANDPVEVLLRKQPPSVTSSFFQRVKFLIEENSVQSYAQKDEYSERRVSVIRGQVLSPDGLGIVGIRVSVDKSSRFGFTLTRKGGWFDMLVNGGGSVTLGFSRPPFRHLTRTVFVPWNEIVVLDPPVIMAATGAHARDGQVEEVKETSQPPCLQHDSEMLKPFVMSSWLPGMVGANPQNSLIFTETQILQQSIVIPGSDVHLLYHSSQSPGYLATVLMQLTGPEVPQDLSLVHLKITIEGELYRKTFEADPNITYTFGWKKRNVYQQKVYGVASARIAIGYQYSTCSRPIWTVQTVTLKGFDVDIADVGGWNLNIHHHYNFHEGILQKGDGSEVHLKELPRIVTTIMGEKGQQRSLLCEPCENKLLSPIALATGPDGSIYVGDFNLVRRITPDNVVYTVLQLSATKVSHQYYMTISPADGHLYISDPEKYQILRVNLMDQIEDPRVNYSPVVGSGLKCVPGDPANCGDGFPAKLAKLNHPKGIAITSDGSIYIADGPNIRYVDGHGIIRTLIGSHTHRGSRSGMIKTTDFESCRVKRKDMALVQLHWPSNLALNLVENKLLFIDEGILFQITDDNQLERVFGCDSSDKVVRPILDLAFSPKGQLYFVTEDSNLYTVKRQGEVLLVRTDKISPYGHNITSASLSAGVAVGERQRNNLDAGLCPP